MPLKWADRVHETTATTGTGTVTLAGAVTGGQTFASRLSEGDTCYYVISDQSGPDWEVGQGTFHTAGPTIARTSVLESSNADALVNFPAGTKDVFLDAPAAFIATLGGAVASVSNADGSLTVSPTTGSVVASLTVPVTVARGGTGDTSLTAYAVLCGGTTSTGAVQPIAGVGTSGQVLTSNGAGALPTFQNATGAVSSVSNADGSLTVSPTTGAVVASLTVPVTVARGGTGDTSLTAYAVLCGGTTSTGAVQPIASVGTAGQVLTSNGAGALPTFQAAAGGVSSVSNADGTLTISPTSGAVVASLNLGHVNTWTAEQTISIASLSAFVVGPSGITNPTLVVETDVASAATGLRVKSNAAGSGVTLEVLSSGSNEDMKLIPKGTGNIITGTSATNTQIDMLADFSGRHLLIGPNFASQASTAFAINLLGSGSNLWLVNDGNDIYFRTGFATHVSLLNNGNLIIGPNSTTNPTLSVITNVASAATGLSVTGNAAGSGVTLTVLSSGTDEDLLVNAKGAGNITVNRGVRPAHLADAAASNDTIYYSTTANKLVYKDSGGVVNNLY